jgi:hypothetical protein
LAHRGLLSECRNCNRREERAKKGGFHD